jgi:hypothetical protein
LRCVDPTGGVSSSNELLQCYSQRKFVLGDSAGSNLHLNSLISYE